ncbi:hypothetical protein [Ottowia massiliensis]|uniref:hypothetical protein n=1 Tax=Ottowia massiliensis TaxID=2045302 RepID=UPI0011AF44F4|nr:hypothetical protein [Ottowia massiliensis]
MYAQQLWAAFKTVLQARQLRFLKLSAFVFQREHFVMPLAQVLHIVPRSRLRHALPAMRQTKFRYLDRD